MGEVKMIIENAKTVNGVSLDKLTEASARGSIKTYWRRADRRESSTRIVSTWDHTQRAAIAR